MLEYHYDALCPLWNLWNQSGVFFTLCRCTNWRRDSTTMSETRILGSRHSMHRVLTRFYSSQNKSAYSWSNSCLLLRVPTQESSRVSGYSSRQTLAKNSIWVRNCWAYWAWCLWATYKATLLIKYCSVELILVILFI